MIHLNDSANPLVKMTYMPSSSHLFSSFPFIQETSVHQLPFLDITFLLSPFPTPWETAARRLLSPTPGVLALKSWRRARGFGTVSFFPYLMAKLSTLPGCSPSSSCSPFQAQNSFPPGSGVIPSAASRQSCGAGVMAGTIPVDVNQGCVGMWILMGFGEDVRGSNLSLALQAGQAGGEEPACERQHLMEKAHWSGGFVPGPIRLSWLRLLGWTLLCPHTPSTRTGLC